MQVIEIYTILISYNTKKNEFQGKIRMLSALFMDRIDFLLSLDSSKTLQFSISENRFLNMIMRRLVGGKNRMEG